MAEQVVEVAGEPLALLGDRRLRERCPGLVELRVPDAQVSHHEHERPDPG